MSIARCNVALRELNFLVGQNGSGKSNFLDALRFVADALDTSLDHAFRDRGGIREVRRRSTGHPTHFGLRLDWELPSGHSGVYSFRIGARAAGAYEVQREFCQVNSPDVFVSSARFEVRNGSVEEFQPGKPPAASADRLFLVAASGDPHFRPLYEGLRRMGFYNLNPDLIREPQPADPGLVLASDGRNLASVLRRLLEFTDTERMETLLSYLRRVVPGVNGVEPKSLGKKETIEFRQEIAGSKEDWRFDADSMSDGTLRTLGVLVALFQPGSPEGQGMSLVGIEEPETAVHPGAAAVLRAALRRASQSTQVIVTSHSPDLLDDPAINGENLIPVIHDAEGSRLGALDEPSRSSIRDRLFTAGELLRQNQLGLEPDSSLETELKAGFLFDGP